jgi:hypothetical protein
LPIQTLPRATISAEGGDTSGNGTLDALQLVVGQFMVAW